MVFWERLYFADYCAVKRILDITGELLSENEELGNNVCVGTGVCNYLQYIGRPTSENDLYSVGAFLLMCAETAKIN